MKIIDRIETLIKEDWPEYEKTQQISNLLYRLRRRQKRHKTITLVLEGERPLSWNMLYSGQGAKRKDGKGLPKRLVITSRLATICYVWSQTMRSV